MGDICNGPGELCMLEDVKFLLWLKLRLETEKLGSIWGISPNFLLGVYLY